MTDFQCICEYKMSGVRCPGRATQEDGLCDNCRTSVKCITYRQIEDIMRLTEETGHEEAIGG